VFTYNERSCPETTRVRHIIPNKWPASVLPPSSTTRLPSAARPLLMLLQEHLSLIQNAPSNDRCCPCKQMSHAYLPAIPNTRPPHTFLLRLLPTLLHVLLLLQEHLLLVTNPPASTTSTGCIPNHQFAPALAVGREWYLALGLMHCRGDMEGAFHRLRKGKAGLAGSVILEYSIAPVSFNERRKPKFWVAIDKTYDFSYGLSNARRDS
jgi:hypothetical protein